MPHFNKRHYQDIARVMQEYRAHCAIFQTREQRLAFHTEFETRMADMFAADNNLFKRDLFLQACRPGQNVRARKVA